MARNLTPTERDRLFGPLLVVGTSGRDTVHFASPPPLVSMQFAGKSVRVHELAAPSLRAVESDLRDAGLLGQVSTAVGYQPRRVRNVDGTNSLELSAHAYGVALDVNAATESQGTPGSDAQRLLVPHFERHGWYWGGRFGVPDPHHFVYDGTNMPAPQSDESEDFAGQPRPEPAPVRSSAGVWLTLGAVGLGVLMAAKRNR